MLLYLLPEIGFSATISFHLTLSSGRPPDITCSEESARILSFRVFKSSLKISGQSETAKEPEEIPLYFENAGEEHFKLAALVSGLDLIPTGELEDFCFFAPFTLGEFRILMASAAFFSVIPRWDSHLIKYFDCGSNISSVSSKITYPKILFSFSFSFN
ncbi:MAG: hypothetical protein KAR31_00385, partial [Candidatus Omnitrophica bacterium]|nr:hypothetical protein [Candidatus Omnitrophota bacterium]